MRSLILFFLLFTASSASADILKFKNGDILTGEIIEQDDKIIKFKPDFAKDIIVSVSTDNILPKNVTDVKIQDKKSYNVTGHIKAGANISSGNTDTKTYDIDSKIVTEIDKNRLTINAVHGSSEEDNNLTRDKSFGGIKYDYFMSDDIYHFTNADFERDKFQNLYLRSAFGTGIGYQLYKTKDLKLSVESGINYVNEDFNKNNSDNDYSAFRWALDYDHKINDYITVYHNHNGLQSFANKNDLIVNAKTGARIPVFASIQAGIEWRLDWDNNPASGKDSIDHEYLMTLGYYF